MKDAKVLTIQDYSSFGQCSLSVALPIISAMGIETVSLPIALLSTHTSGFKGYTYVDLKDNALPAAKHLKTLGIDFDYIYLGYLGKSQTAKFCLEIADLFPDAQLIVDPAMAEGGELYDGLTPDLIESMAQLCRRSYLSLPNLSEACLLAGEKYAPIQNEKSILTIVEKLCNRGIKDFIITGIKTKDGMSLAYHDGFATHFIKTDTVDGEFLGSGDVFASSLVGALANDVPLEKCIKLAAAYTYKTIELTSKDKSHWYGLKFEKTIPYLLELLNSFKYG